MSSGASVHKLCPLCGEEKPESFKIFYDDFIKLYKCRTCGLISSYQGPGRLILEIDYEVHYALSFTKTGEFRYPKRVGVLQDTVDRILKMTGPCKILDIGCGEGQFLSYCVKKGFDCYGAELSKQLAEYANDKIGAKVTQGWYGESMFPENSFDVITILQVLEHILDPLEMLGAAHKHLRPGGLLLIELPSLNAPHFLLYRMTRFKKIVTRKAIVRSHLNYFSPKTTAAIAEKAGFKKVDLITGRWKSKYGGLLKLMATVTDPLMNATKIGGILYIGAKE
jgi:2-polyprenyl-3-methyl-5-hydroxy-6-metoxy-1,4-benzoquinol methylase